MSIESVHLITPLGRDTFISRIDNNYEIVYIWLQWSDISGKNYHATFYLKIQRHFCFQNYSILVHKFYKTVRLKIIYKIVKKNAVPIEKSVSTRSWVLRMRFSS